VATAPFDPALVRALAEIYAKAAVDQLIAEEPTTRKPSKKAVRKRKGKKNNPI
jgi:hypothetical protein